MNKALQQVREKLGHLTLACPPTLWLQTGIPMLNRVIGHSDNGIPYGRITEISGKFSEGKTTLALAFAALVQYNGGLVIWDDLEHSFVPDYAISRGIAACPICKGTGRSKDEKGCRDCGGGASCRSCDGSGKSGKGKKCVDCLGSGEDAGEKIDTSRLIWLRPYIGSFRKKNAQGKMVADKEERLTTAQEITAEIDSLIGLLRKTNDRIMVVIDSIPAMLPQSEAAAGIEGGSQFTEQSLPKFLGHLLRRWVGLAQTTNTWILAINQMRQNVRTTGWFTPGGNAFKFYAHVRISVNRKFKSGDIIDRGKLIGFQGTMFCVKNKTGGVEKSRVGYRVLFDRKRVEFCNASEIAPPKKEDVSAAE
jgi:RecA/RadA recombinase